MKKTQQLILANPVGGTAKGLSCGGTIRITKLYKYLKKNSISLKRDSSL